MRPGTGTGQTTRPALRRAGVRGRGMRRWPRPPRPQPRRGTTGSNAPIPPRRHHAEGRYPGYWAPNCHARNHTCGPPPAPLP
eukprot:4177257-Lingulodinium_polyedra.AAC.1